VAATVASRKIAALGSEMQSATRIEQDGEDELWKDEKDDRVELGKLVHVPVR